MPYGEIKRMGPGRRPECAPDSRFLFHLSVVIHYPPKVGGRFFAFESRTLAFIDYTTERFLEECRVFLRPM